MINLQRYLFSSGLILFLLKPSVCTATVEVVLKQGVLLGKVQNTFLRHKDYVTFKGIPYAEPPVGELRFKPPKPHRGWEGAYEAYDSKLTCVQNNVKMKNAEQYGLSGAEDCLYINVYTPSVDGTAPVAVFDYHDNFRTSYNGSEKYSPELFTEENVVVVTINHRLGILGYLTTEDENIPANNGLRDYLLGLKWIKANIHHFGGDTNRVTLMGNRGGSAVSNIMLYSKQASGLFNAVTMQSGTIFEAVYFPDNPREIAFKLADLLNIQTNDSNTLVNELQQLNIDTLYSKELDINDVTLYEKYQISILLFSPTVEPDSADAIITTKPEDGIIVNDVPVLIGQNSREGLEHTSYLLFKPNLLDNLKDFFVHFPVRTGYRFDMNNSAFKEYVKDVTTFYLTDGILTYSNLLEYAVYVGDTIENYAINYAARKISNELKSPTFYYMFDFYGTLNENMQFMLANTRGPLNSWGATLGDELCYLHVCSRIKKHYDQVVQLMTVQNEIKVMKKMVRLWTNFIKTGNPTPAKQDDVLRTLNWQPIDKESGDLKYLHITKNFRMSANPLGEREKFWDRILDKYAKMVVDGVVQEKHESRDEL